MLCIIGGIRSDAGKEARDIFLSLKQRCSKLGINFTSFLKDRVAELFERPRLAEIIRERSKRAEVPC